MGDEFVIKALQRIGLDKYIPNFVEHDIDQAIFLTLTKQETTELIDGKLGPQKKLLQEIERLNAENLVVVNGNVNAQLTRQNSKTLDQSVPLKPNVNLNNSADVSNNPVINNVTSIQVQTSMTQWTATAAPSLTVSVPIPKPRTKINSPPVNPNIISENAQGQVYFASATVSKTTGQILPQPRKISLQNGQVTNTTKATVAGSNDTSTPKQVAVVQNKIISTAQGTQVPKQVTLTPKQPNVPINIAASQQSANAQTTTKVVKSAKPAPLPKVTSKIKPLTAPTVNISQQSTSQKTPTQTKAPTGSNTTEIPVLRRPKSPNPNKGNIHRSTSVIEPAGKEGFTASSLVSKVAMAVAVGTVSRGIMNQFSTKHTHPGSSVPPTSEALTGSNPNPSPLPSTNSNVATDATNLATSPETVSRNFATEETTSTETDRGVHVTESNIHSDSEYIENANTVEEQTYECKSHCIDGNVENPDIPVEIEHDEDDFEVEVEHVEGDFDEEEYEEEGEEHFDQDENEEDKEEDEFDDHLAAQGEEPIAVDIVDGSIIERGINFASRLFESF